MSIPIRVPLTPSLQQTGWRRSTARRDLLWVAAVAVLGGGLVITQRDSVAALVARFPSLDWRFALLCLVPLCAVEAARAWRWQVLYGAERPSYRSMLQAVSLAQAASALMPVRLGELLRLIWAGPSAEGLARGVASLALAKVLDTIVFAILLVAVVGQWALNAPQVAIGGAIAASGIGLAALAWVVRGRFRGPVARAIKWTTAYLRELDARTFLISIGCTVAAWALGLIANGLVLLAVGQAPTWDSISRIMASGLLVGVAPGPPGRVGVYEAAVAGALITTGLDAETALVAALLLHCLQLAKVGGLALLATRWR